MVRKTGSRACRAARVTAWFASTAVVLVLAGACAEERGSIGDDCLKDQDCLSGVCSELHCVAPPPLLDAAYVPVVDATVDAPAETSAETSTAGDGAMVVEEDSTTPVDAPAEAAEEEAGTPDAGTTPPSDAAGDAVDEGHFDAATDGSTDAIADSGGPG
jgi:hypothetical protein